MALIECAECNHTISSSASHCPNCGAPTSNHDRMTSNHGRVTSNHDKMTELLSAGLNLQSGTSLLHRTRTLRILITLGFAGFGLIAMLDVELFNLGLVLAGSIIGIYFLVTIIRHLYALASSPTTFVPERLSDLVEIAAHSLILAVSSGFWFGFSATAIGFGADVPEVYAMLGGLFSALFGITCFASIPLGFASVLAHLQKSQSSQSTEDPEMGHL